MDVATSAISLLGTRAPRITFIRDASDLWIFCTSSTAWRHSKAQNCSMGMAVSLVVSASNFSWIIPRPCTKKINSL